MNNLRKRNRLLLSFFIVSIIISILYFNINLSYARDDKKHLKISSFQYNDNDESFTVFQKFQMDEFSENEGIKKNISSIDINLGSSRWNVSDIELNITDMYFENETKVIEDYPVDSIRLYKLIRALAVQINITALTRIYGIKIFGRRVDAGASTPIYLQIHGYNTGTDKPNEIIYCSIPLNMTNSDNQWRIHEFSTPVDLPIGKYCLVLNGTKIGPGDKDEYRWYFNDDPNEIKFPNLYSWEYSGGLWGDGYINRPFLYQLDQRVIQDFFPEEINMTAEIDGTFHPIENCNNVGTGNITLSFGNYFPNASILNIPIKNNVSDALIFNLSYYIKLNNIISYDGSVLIKENLDNIWTLNLNLDRFGYNYSIKYNYPNNWKCISVFNGTMNITSSPEIVKDGDFLYIFNDIITQNAKWTIIANSTNYDISLNVPEPPVFNAGEKLGFFVQSPVKKGNYTFVLIDRIGIIEFEQTKTITSTDSFSFNYTLPSDASSGEWMGYVFWNNESDAGLKTQIFQISGSSTSPILTNGDSNDDGGAEESVGIHPILIFAIFLIAGISSAVSITSYISAKRYRKIQEDRRQKVHNKFNDIINLNYIIIIDKKSGLNIYEQFFTGEVIDTTLIVGFLDAIRVFGIELTGANEKSQTITLEYKDSKISMSEFKNFRILLIMRERPSEDLLKSITALSYDIENEYGTLIKKFKGSKIEFGGIRDLIEKHLYPSFIDRLIIVERKNVKLTSREKSMIYKAKLLMKKHYLDYFFTSFLLSDKKFKSKDVETIMSLIDKKIFQPIKLESTE